MPRRRGREEETDLTRAAGLAGETLDEGTKTTVALVPLNRMSVTLLHLIVFGFWDDTSMNLFKIARSMWGIY